MTDLSIQNLLMIALLVITGMVVAYQIKAHTGKSMFDSLTGPRGRNKGPQAPPAPGRRVVRNGTRSELTAFISQLLRFSQKNGLRLIAPGTVAHNGQTARLTALLVAPHGVIGVYCLGFGGTITPALLPDPWKQHINGNDRTFDNPVKICQEQHDLVAAAMETAGIRTDLTIIAVFTNPQADLPSAPAGIYTRDRFFAYLDEFAKADSTGQPAIDPRTVWKTLADLAGIKTRKTK